MVNKIQLDNLIRIYSVWIKLFLVSPDIIIWWHTGLNPAQCGKKVEEVLLYLNKAVFLQNIP